VLGVQTLNTQFEHELKKLIDQEIERQKDILEAGVAVPDFAAYRHVNGQISALKRVRDSYCEEVNTLLSKRT
jgi:hypothetical protein